MYQEDPGLEQRLSRFEAQLDRFSLALRQWQDTQGQAKSESASDVDQRIRMIEATLSREADALRQLHEEPLKQMQAQATSLKEILGDLSRSLQALGELGITAAPATPTTGSAASWPLERVVHLHDELRRAADGGGHRELHEGTPQQDIAIGALRPYTASPDAAEPSDRRPRVFDATAAHEQAAPAPASEDPARGRRARYITWGLVISAATLLALGLGWRTEARLNEAAARIAAAERQVAATTQLANREVTAAREDAGRQVAEARQLAQRAETVSAILAAPDLVRFNLTGDPSSAQLLWSRTRGLVLSGSRLPAAEPDTTYQLWLVTNARPVSAGLFVPDAVGRATLVIDTPPRIAGPVVGAAVTLEPTGGRQEPSGRTVLARYPEPRVPPVNAAN